MKFLLAFILLCPISLQAQKFPVLRDALQSGSLAKVNNYIFNNTEVNAHEFPENNIYWRLYREILPGYYEGTLQIYHSEPYINERKRTYSVRIQMLVKDSSIFYYSVKYLNEKGAYADVRDSSTWKEPYNIFLQTFKQTYGTALQAKYLFIDSINYGNRCKADGEETPEYKQMKEYVSKQNQKALGDWLRSGNAELQLYAVKGFKLLEERTVTVAKEYKPLIELVLAKKGNVNLCRDGVERRMQMAQLRTEL